MKAFKCNRSSEPELYLEELRKELSAIRGGKIPHFVLSIQQISRLSSQKPITIKEATALVSAWQHPSMFRIIRLYILHFPLLFIDCSWKRLENERLKYKEVRY